MPPSVGGRGEIGRLPLLRGLALGQPGLQLCAGIWAEYASTEQPSFGHLQALAEPLGLVVGKNTGVDAGYRPGEWELETLALFLRAALAEFSPYLEVDGQAVGGTSDFASTYGAAWLQLSNDIAEAARGGNAPARRAAGCSCASGAGPSTASIGRPA